MRLKLLVSLAGVVLLVGLSSSASVAAHILKANNGIAAELHIPPYDAPVANQSQPLQFQFGTTSGSFRINQYDVSVTILSGDRVIKRQAVLPAYHGAQAAGETTVIFPEPAVYTIKLAGISRTGTPNFAMTYEVRVTGTAKAQGSTGTQILLVGVACLIILIMIATRQIVRRAQHDTPSSGESDRNRAEP